MTYEFKIRIEKTISVSIERSFTSDVPLSRTQVKGRIEEECRALREMAFDSLAARPDAEVKTAVDVWAPGHYMERR